MKRKSVKFDKRMDFRMTDEQEEKVFRVSNERNIKPPQLMRDLIDNLK